MTNSLNADGFTLLPGFLRKQSLLSARKNLAQYYPTPAELRASPEKFAGILDEIDNLKHEFPFTGDVLNDLATSPKIVSLVGGLLGTADLRLSQAAVWAKYAGFGTDYEQDLHADYEGNTLVIPRDDGDFRQVNLIVYLTDVSADLGPTRVVPLRYTHKDSLWPPWRSREDYPNLYRHERPILARAGDVLVFGMTLFHRASPIVASDGWRLSLHLVYRAAAHDFQGYHHWPRHGENPHLSRFITRATPAQRALLGFPAPGNRYWNPHTLDEVSNRYPGIDLSPYRAV